MTHETTPAPRRRRFTRVWQIAAAVAGIALIAWFFSQDSDAAGADPADAFDTEAAVVTTVDEMITGPFTMTDRSEERFTPVINTTGVVTAVHVDDDDRVEPLQHVMDVNGDPVFALVGDTPFYRPVTTRSDDGDDIRTIEDNLVDAGYDVGERDGSADRDLADALKQWQEDEDLRETGAFDPSLFIWFPAGHTIDDMFADIGDIVGVEQPIAEVVKAGSIVALARIEQNDVITLEPGLDVALDLDGIPEIDLTGSVAKIDDRPLPDTSDYPVEVRLDEIPSDLREGMEGEVEILIRRHRDVVVVPTGAVSGTAEAPTVRVLVNGRAEVRSIETGLVTPARTVVRSGVTAGDLIIVGEREA